MAFQEYYKTTILLGESDVNKLNDLTETIEGYNFYVQDDIITIVAGMLEEKTEFVQTYFGNPDFQNFVNARVFSAVINRLGSM